MCTCGSACSWVREQVNKLSTNNSAETRSVPRPETRMSPRGLYQGRSYSDCQFSRSSTIRLVMVSLGRRGRNHPRGSLSTSRNPCTLPLLCWKNPLVPWPIRFTIPFWTVSSSLSDPFPIPVSSWTSFSLFGTRSRTPPRSPSSSFPRRPGREQPVSSRETDIPTFERSESHGCRA